MTTKTIKTGLFAILMFAMILPFSAMNFAEAEKTQNGNSDELFAEFIELANRAQTIQAKINALEHEGKYKKVNALEKRLASIEDKMADLQQQNIDAVKLSADELNALEEQADALLEKFTNPDSPYYVDSTSTGYFIDQINKKPHFTFEDKVPQFSTNTFEALEENMDAYTVDDTSFTFGFVEKNSHYINCSEREDDCNYGIGGIAIKVGSNTSTLGFSAKQDGDKGFVTVAHGVGNVGSAVYQYPTRDVGDVKTKDTGNCDCAFVETNSELSAVYKVYTGASQTSSITSYATSGNPSVGTWLMMTGVTSEVEYGTYAGWHPTYEQMASYYDSDDGDSGAPVTSIGSSVKLYGMHTSNDSTYSYATPYNTLKSDLDLD